MAEGGPISDIEPVAVNGGLAEMRILEI